MNRRTLLRLGAGSALAALATGVPALAQQKLVLKAADVHPLGYPTVEAVLAMGRKLEAASGGRLSIQMYPSMQLGGEKEMIEQAQVGALANARVSVGPMGPLVPELNVFNLPFMFRDDAHMEQVIDGPIGDELLKKLSDHPTAGLIGLCWMNAGTRNVYNSKKPIKTIGSFWPYATTLFDYIHRAMPYTAPGFLSIDDTYSVEAYLLNLNGILPDGATLDRATLLQVKMPNRDGFVPEQEFLHVTNSR